MRDYEIEESYQLMLDNVYGTVMVAGMQYDTSIVLKDVDPIAYRVGMSDYESWADCTGGCGLAIADCECEDEWKCMEDCSCINCQRVIREREST